MNRIVPFLDQEIARPLVRINFIDSATVGTVYTSRLWPKKACFYFLNLE